MIEPFGSIAISLISSRSFFQRTVPLLACREREVRIPSPHTDATYFPSAESAICRTGYSPPYPVFSPTAIRLKLVFFLASTVT